ncbi:pyridoxal phosphate-dependent decarboxylase family protein [Pseudohalioglobus lutimaris]|uniref:pyridoxal phosphate-dependent decarboxylase family protein n=1 Tax=Pseudohalioglobus lutimaris TaxID=1737061 RepID=UPI001A9E12B8|nr:pyridoxal-dependent decarboxylase [Pseudohalioglobus lutimaris]
MSTPVNKAEGLNDPSLLEPADWEEFRAEAHRALDVALNFVRDRPQEAAWEETPPGLKVTDKELPVHGQPLGEVVNAVQRDVLPYTLGNTHPRFWGWVNGSGTPSGVISQAFVGAINANMGGRDHSPMYIERQLLAWMRQLFSYPEDASGLICTGTSYATLLALAVARQHALGESVREQGNGGAALVAYCSEQAHVSVSKAMEILGLGSRALRSVPVRPDFTLDHAALDAMIRSDVALGMKPFAVISCVGAVNTGAIDELEIIGQICRENGLWHHVDGAFGALIVLSPELRHRLAGIEHADSIAFDFHKWMHVTYAAACVLIRDGELHRRSFATSHAYLQGESRGVAAGAPWPCDYGIDLSRGFAALGIWMLLNEMGTKRLGEAIYRNCRQAAWLGQQVDSMKQLQRLAPVSLNIVCFRFAPAGLSRQQLNRINRHIVVTLHCDGIAVPSFTELAGETAIRVCIANHRTRLDDLQALLDAVIEIGARLMTAGLEGEEFDVSTH